MATKKQHYVPRFLLKNFSINEDKVYVFDKHAEKTFGPTNVFNIAHENYFNEITDKNGKKINLEDMFSEIEGKIAPIIKRIIETENISDLTTQERSLICTFIVMQRLRTRANLENIKYMAGEMFRKMGLFAVGVDDGFKKIQDEHGISDERASELLEKCEVVTDENYAKYLALGQYQNIPDLLPRLMSMDFMLFKDKTESLWISDHPIAFHNDKDFGPRGNIGLLVPYIQIYLPLSKSLILSLWCPLIMRDTLSEWLKLSIRNPKLAKTYRESNDLLNAYDNKTICGMSIENVTFFNSLQMCFCEQYVYSSKNNFILAKQMISDDAKFKSGFRPTIH